MDETRDDNTKWVSQTETDKYDITYMCNLKDDTNEFIYKTETDSQSTNLWLQRGRGNGEEWSGSLGLADANYYV